MTEQKWKYISSSVIGSRHLDLGLPCQDACACSVVSAFDGSEVLIAVVSDGAGSAKKAQTGSSKACTDFMLSISSALMDQSDLSFLTIDYIREWITEFNQEIKLIAESEESAVRDYACTFLTGVIGKDSAVFAQIGDGGIVFSEEDQNDCYQLVFSPQQGEYVNQTNFLTDMHAEEKLMFRFREGKVEQISVFSDGMQSLVLNGEDQVAYVPFFKPIFEGMRKLPAGRAMTAEVSMREYLNSEKILDKTDDDKSLIFATRCNVKA